MAAKKSKPYSKLPGRGRRGSIFTTGYTSLWIGADHLMQVEETRMSEDYKRFYFKDIKAIIVRRTRSWAITNWILLGLAVLFMALFGVGAVNAVPSDRTAFLMVGGGIAGVFLFLALINSLLGPTCICHLRTPVQQEQLPSLKRMRTARKALKRIREAVEAVQGPLTEEGRQEIAELIAQNEALPVPPADPSGTGSPIKSQGPPALPNSPGKDFRWDLALIGSLITLALMEALSIAGHRGILVITLGGLAACAVGCISIAKLVRLPRGVGKLVAWTRVGIWGFWFVVNSAFTFVASVRFGIEHPGKRADLSTVIQSMPESYYLVMTFAAAIYLLWAVFEILALVKAKKQRRPQPPVALEALAPVDPE